MLKRKRPASSNQAETAEDGAVAAAASAGDRQTERDEPELGHPSGAAVDAGGDTTAGGEGANTAMPVTTEMRDLVVGEPVSKQRKIIGRPDGGGEMGTPQALLTNHFKLTIEKEFTVAQYDVSITCLGAPKEKTGAKKDSKSRGVPIRRREENFVLFCKFVEKHPSVFGHTVSDTCRLIYDRSKMLFCFPELQNLEQGNTKSLKIRGHLRETDQTRKEESKIYQMDIEFTGMVTVGELQAAYNRDQFKRNRQALTVINLILRHRFFASNAFVQLRRSLFDPSDRVDLGCGREMLRGFHQSANIVSGWKLTLNVDLVGSAFYRPQAEPKTLIAFAREFFGLRGSLPKLLSDAQVKMLRKELAGVRLKSHLNHDFANGRVTDYTKSARSHTFDFRKDESNAPEKVSVEQYYKTQHGKQLLYPLWPLIEKGNSPSAACFPFEMLRIAERQPVAARKLTDQDHTNIIRATAIPPDQRLARLKKMIEGARADPDPCEQHYGLSIDTNLIEVPGRSFNPPQLQYNNRTVTANNGSWSSENLTFAKPGTPIAKWFVVVVKATGRGGGGGLPLDSGDISNFVTHLRKRAEKMGLQLADPVLPCLMTTERNLKDDCTKLAQSVPDLNLILCIFPSRNFSLYGQFKYLGDKELDVCTQVILETNVRRVLTNPARQTSMLSNICLKLNAKRGGINAKLVDGRDKLVSELLAAPILFIGVDVSHPDEGHCNSPSIAALASSLDQRPHLYKGFECVMKQRKEIIPFDRMKEMVKESLKSYKRNTKLKPQQIVCYRDGVSEGEFEKVMEQELCGIQQACKDIESEYKPQITFIIVDKRHHTRLFKKNVLELGQLRNPERNVAAGTTVDKVIVHPYEFDFYLCSHQGIQGTSKQPHYYVLYDDHNYNSDHLQALTYYLCHTYARATKSVSLPAPVYYAHLIAYRARVRLTGSGFDTDSACASATETELTEQELQKIAETIKVGEKTANSMYWQ